MPVTDFRPSCMGPTEFERTIPVLEQQDPSGELSLLQTLHTMSCPACKGLAEDEETLKHLHEKLVKVGPVVIPIHLETMAVADAKRERIAESLRDGDAGDEG